MASWENDAPVASPTAPTTPTQSPWDGDSAVSVHDILPAITHVESGGNAKAVGPMTKWGTAKGKNQLLDSTAKAVGVTNPFDPAQSDAGATKLLEENYKRYGNWDDAIRAYHGGTDRKQWGPKTEKYLNDVLSSIGKTAPATGQKPWEQDKPADKGTEQQEQAKPNKLIENLNKALGSVVPSARAEGMDAPTKDAPETLRSQLHNAAQASINSPLGKIETSVNANIRDMLDMIAGTPAFAIKIGATGIADLIYLLKGDNEPAVKSDALIGKLSNTTAGQFALNPLRATSQAMGLPTDQTTAVGVVGELLQKGGGKLVPSSASPNTKAALGQLGGVTMLAGVGGAVSAYKSLHVVSEAFKQSKAVSNIRDAVESPIAKQPTSFTSALTAEEFNHHHAQATIAASLAKPLMQAGDKATVAHEYEVAQTASYLGSKVGMKASDVSQLHVAAMIHDDMKALPEIQAAIHSGKPLTPEQRVIVDKHAAEIHQKALDSGIDEKSVWLAEHHHDKAIQNLTERTPTTKALPGWDDADHAAGHDVSGIIGGKEAETLVNPIQQQQRYILTGADQLNSLLGRAGRDYPFHDEGGVLLPRTQDSVHTILQQKIDNGIIDASVGAELHQLLNDRQLPKNVLKSWDSLSHSFGTDHIQAQPLDMVDWHSRKVGYTASGEPLGGSFTPHKAMGNLYVKDHAAADKLAYDRSGEIGKETDRGWEVTVPMSYDEVMKLETRDRVSSVRGDDNYGKKLPYDAEKGFPIRPSAVRTRADDTYKQFSTVGAAIKHAAKIGDAFDKEIVSLIHPYVKDATFTVVEPDTVLPSDIRKGLSDSRGLQWTRHAKHVDGIWVNSSATGAHAQGVNAETILHEAVHQATSRKIDLGSMSVSKGTALAGHVKDLHATTKHITNQYALEKAQGRTTEGLDDVAPYALSSPHEVISYALTDKHMQAFLKSTPGVIKNTVWGDFVEGVRKVLGVSPKHHSALSDLLDITERLVKETVPEHILNHEQLLVSKGQAQKQVNKKNQPQHTTIPLQLPQHTTIPLQLPQHTAIPLHQPQHTTIPLQLPQHTTIPLQLPQSPLVAGVLNGKPISIHTERELAYALRQSNYTSEATVTVLRQNFERASKQGGYTPALGRKFRDYSEATRAGNASITLTPAEQQIYNTHIQPLRNEFTDTLNNIAKLSGVPVRTLQTELGTRLALDQRSALDRLLGSESMGGFGRGVKKPGSQKGLTYYALEDGTIISGKEGGGVLIWKNGNVSGTIKSTKKLKAGDTVNGQKVVQAQQRNIEDNTATRYVKDDLATWSWRLAEAKKFEQELATLESLKQSNFFKAVAMKRGNGNIPKAWRPLAEANKIPQMRDYYFEPKTAEVFDDWVGANHGDRIAMIEALNNVSIKSFMINPTGHINNEAVHWFGARGLSSWVTPYGNYRLTKTFPQAVRSVLSQDHLQVEIARQGGHLLAMNVKNQNAWESMLSDELKRQASNGTMAYYAKKLGMSPVKFANLVSSKASSAMWTARDFMYTQLVLEHHMTHPKASMQEAIMEVNQHMPSYEIPSRVLGSRTISQGMQNRNLTVFSAYHYGMLNSLGTIGKELSNPKTTLTGLDHLAALVFVQAAIYPALDYMYQQLFNDPNAQARRAGPLHLLEVGKKVLSGEATPTRFASLVLTPSPSITTLGQLFENRYFYSGQPIYNQSLPQAAPFQVGEYMFNQMLAPGQAATQMVEGKMTWKQYLERQSDVESPNVAKKSMSDYYKKKDALKAKIKWEQKKRQYGLGK